MQGGGGGGGGGRDYIFHLHSVLFFYIYYISKFGERERDWYHVKLFVSNLDICFLFI